MFCDNRCPFWRKDEEDTFAHCIFFEKIIFEPVPKCIDDKGRVEYFKELYGFL